MEYFTHKNSIVETKNIGRDTKIWAFVHILKDVIIGKNCNICDFCYIEDGVRIGDNVTIKNGVYLWDGILIEDDVFIGPSVVFTNDLKPRSKVYPEKYLKTLIKKGASIGANATILPGLTIGQYSMVAAGSVVTKNVNDFEMVAGNPAEFKHYICKCTANIEFKDNYFECVCGQKYKLCNNKVLNI